MLACQILDCNNTIFVWPGIRLLYGKKNRPVGCSADDDNTNQAFINPIHYTPVTFVQSDDMPVTLFSGANMLKLLHT